MENYPYEHIVKYHHVGFVVVDLDRSIDFYVTVLGFKLFSRWQETTEQVKGGMGVVGAALDLAQLIGHGCMLELFQYTKEPGSKVIPKPNNVSASHISFLVKDIVGFIDELKERGVVICGNIVENPGDQWVHIEDPDGIRIEFMEWSAK